MPTAPPVAGTCALVSAPARFEPNPPGATRPVNLSSGFTNLQIPYGAGRLLNLETFGYSVLDVSNPAAPVALLYDDLRSDGVKAAGDGQSYTFGAAVSDDGQRIAIALGGPGDGWGTVVGQPAGVGFRFTGSFGIDRAPSVALQHVGTRYIAYAFDGAGVTAADVTSLPAALAPLNMTGETTRWPTGLLARMLGNFLVYLSSGTVRIVDASSPGSPGNITGQMPTTSIGASDLGGRTPQYYAAALDGSTLRVLLELRPLAGENSPSYALVSVSPSLVKTAGAPWRVPAAVGESWGYAGISAALVSSGGGVYAVMPAARYAPSLLLRVHSVALSRFGATSSSFDIPAALYSQGFSGFGMPSSFVLPVLLVPTGPAAFALRLACGM